MSRSPSSSMIQAHHEIQQARSDLLNSIDQLKLNLQGIGFPERPSFQRSFLFFILTFGMLGFAFLFGVLLKKSNHGKSSTPIAD